MRFVGRREGVLPELIEQMEWAEDDDRREHAADAVRRVQLRRALGDPRRRGALHGRRRGGVPRAAVRARDARSGPADPDLGRAADLELPAVAGGVLASCTSPTCCGRTSRARTSRRRWPPTRRACAASGGAECRDPLAPPAARAAQEGHVGPDPADPGRDPGGRVRGRDHLAGRSGCSRPGSGRWRSSACTSCR